MVCICKANTRDFIIIIIIVIIIIIIIIYTLYKISIYNHMCLFDLHLPTNIISVFMLKFLNGYSPWQSESHRKHELPEFAPWWTDKIIQALISLTVLS